jgi:hypothetical protein
MWRRFADPQETANRTDEATLWIRGIEDAVTTALLTDRADWCPFLRVFARARFSSHGSSGTDKKLPELCQFRASDCFRRAQRSRDSPVCVGAFAKHEAHFLHLKYCATDSDAHDIRHCRRYRLGWKRFAP